jgi:threonine dehydratase
MSDAIKQTLLARVYDVAVETPLQKAHNLSQALDCAIYIKREDLQPVHSFKIRGAYNKIAQLSEAEKKCGVIAASAGNHAQGVALSAQKLGIKAEIVMPKTTPRIKLDAVKSYGAKVILHGDSYSDAYEHSLIRAKKSGATFIHPFDDKLVIAGQGTIGREILEQLPTASHIFVSIGGGGLIAGIAQFIKNIRPDIQIIGVEPEDSNAMGLSLQANKRITLEHVGIFADGVAVKQVGERTFAIAQKYVDEVITVTNDQICAAIKSIFEETRSIVEPAGALGVAGAIKYIHGHALNDKNIVAICSGANMTFERLQYIAERTLVGSGNESLFSIMLPEKPGALAAFCNDIVKNLSISEFNYRKNDSSAAHILVGILLQEASDKHALLERLTDFTYEYTDLSADDLTKQHIRHMIGGKNKNKEFFYEINFPERPGALQDFLNIIGNEWNISLFHYRGQGADTGSVFIGFESMDLRSLNDALGKSGYEFQRVNSNAVRQLL